MRWVGKYAVLYRVVHVDGIVQDDEGYWMLTHHMGDLRAKVFGIRVPVAWAADCMIAAGRLK